MQYTLSRIRQDAKYEELTLTAGVWHGTAPVMYPSLEPNILATVLSSYDSK